MGSAKFYGRDYISKDFDYLSAKSGIQHQLTNAYTPQQNETAERMNRTLTEKAKCLLFDVDLPNRFWAEAINMASYLYNQLMAKSPMYSLVRKLIYPI